MKKQTVLILALIAIILVTFSLLISLLIKQTNIPIKKNNVNTNSKSQSNENSRDTQGISTESNAQPQLTSNNSPSSGSSGAGGGSSSSESSSAASSCPKIQISYALRNFIKSSECLSYSGSICISKKATCSVEVQNLDNVFSGKFTIKIILHEIENNNILQEFTDYSTIDSQTSYIFKKTLNFESQSQEGEANKDYTCSFQVLEIPKKEVC